MATIPGGVRVTGFISPTDTTDVYSTHDSLYGKGGYKEVADLTERDAITDERRRIGMQVYVSSSDTFYYLSGSILNTD